MAWQPEKEPLQQLVQCLKDSLSGQDKNAQKKAEVMLREAKSSQDYTKYLAFLLSSVQQPDCITLPRDNYDMARSASAIALKNAIKSDYKSISDPAKEYIRSVILEGLKDPDVQIRNYAGIVITEIVRQGGILSWPQLLSNLIAMIENSDGKSGPNSQEGAMAALSKICEDNSRALDSEYSGERPLEFLFPKLISFTMSALPKVRENALIAICVFVPETSNIVLSNLPSLLRQIFVLSDDPNYNVRIQVCRSLIQIAEISPEMIIANLDGLVSYAVNQQKNQENVELALEATEFLMTLSEDSRLVGHLSPYLPIIVPSLLASMVYSEDEMLQLEAEYEDADEEDRPEDIKPAFATNRSRNQAKQKAEATPPLNGSQDDEMSEGEISDDEVDMGDPEEEWSLRKCSAAVLDVLASRFHGAVFQVTLPYLKENLTHKDWPNREAAVLALGAIADGCMEAMQPHLPELTPFLISLLEDKEPVVRQIVCWTLGRYSFWAANLDVGGRQKYLEPIMEGLLKLMLDRNKKVQESAASGFANLEEKAKIQLLPYCKVIIQHFVQCFDRYKDRNMFILYDCVQTLAEHIGPELKNPELVAILMPALIKRWNKVADQSREMFPLLECLSYVATALGESFEPFSEPIFTRCVSIIHHNLEEALRAANNPNYDPPERDFLVTSLDLLSAIIQSLPETRSSKLVREAQPNLFELLSYCMKSVGSDVRQSSYALLGDFAVYLFKQLQPWVPSMLEILIAQLDMSHVQYDGEETNFAVINNACWSAGEIAMRHKEQMQPYVNRLLEKLYVILIDKDIPDSLLENASIALGRLGFGCAPAIAPHLGNLSPLFLRVIHRVDWTDEKAHALIGYCQIVMCSPEAIMGDQLLMLFMEFAAAPSAFLRYKDSCGDDTSEPVERGTLFRRLVAQYTAHPEFNKFISTMPERNAAMFRELYLS